MSDEIARWAGSRVEALIARAEAEAVAELKSALLMAATTRASPKPSEPPAAAPRVSAPAPPPGATLVWAYCVTRSADAAPTGLPDLVPLATGLERVEHGGLAAVISHVPVKEYGEEALHESLNDLAWLERLARAHETILERVGEQVTIVPLRLCTIFRDEAGVKRMLEENEEALTAALDRLAGRQEWAVKLLVDPARLEAAASGGDEEDEAGTGTGTAYLLGRRAERERRAAAERLGRELAEDVHARLQDWAADAVVNPPQSRELSGHADDMLLNGAYLVESARADELRELVAELQQRHRGVGARLDVAGPLPPFNFVSRPEGVSRS